MKLSKFHSTPKTAAPHSLQRANTMNSQESGAKSNPSGKSPTHPAGESQTRENAVSREPGDTPEVKPFPKYDITKADRFSYGNASALGHASEEAYSPAAGNPHGLGFNHEVGSNQFMVKKNQDHTVVAFAGTNPRDPRDLIADAKFLKTPIEGGRVHSGFEDAYKQMKPPLMQALGDDKKTPVVITGHSLGAGVGTLAADDLEKEGYNVKRPYFYGSPRVGDPKFAKTYNAELPDTHRIVNEDDPVTTVPKFNYKHVGTPVYLGSDGTVVPKRESPRWTWPWNVPSQRLGMHDMKSYNGKLDKLQELNSPNASLEDLPGSISSS